MAMALIGSTGFVGRNLARQTVFDDAYHSTNIGEIAGKSYDVVVCAGAPAAKWIANREPERDWHNLQRLMRCLGQVETGRLILISTVDVYPDPVGVDEASPIDPQKVTAYGRHRYAL